MAIRAKHPWTVVGVLWFAFLINYLDRQVVFSIFPILSRELHFSNTQLGLTGTVFTWVYCLSMPVAGRLADLFPRNRLVVIGILLWSMATLATGLSGSVNTFLASRAAMGITEALFMPAALGLIASVHPDATRSRALAIFATGQFAGIAIGGWYGGWAADHTGWRVGFYSLALLGLCYGAAMGLAFRRGQSRDRGTAPRSRPLEIFKSDCWLALAVAFFAFCSMLWILLAWLASFIHERFGQSLTQSGFNATIFLQAGSALGTLTGGLLGDQAARRIPGGRFYVASAGLLACAPCAWFSMNADSLHATESCAAAFGFFGGLLIANLYAAAYDVVSEDNHGIAAGALNLVGGFAAGAGILLTGLFKQSFGVAFSIHCAAVAAAASSLILVAVIAKRYESDRAKIAGQVRGGSPK